MSLQVHGYKFIRHAPPPHNWETGAEASVLFLCTVSETQKVLSQASPSSLLPCYPLDGQFHLLWKESIKYAERRAEVIFAKTLEII